GGRSAADPDTERAAADRAGPRPAAAPTSAATRADAATSTAPVPVRAGGQAPVDRTGPQGDGDRDRRRRGGRDVRRRHRGGSCDLPERPAQPTQLPVPPSERRSAPVPRLPAAASDAEPQSVPDQLSVGPNPGRAPGRQDAISPGWRARWFPG